MWTIIIIALLVAMLDMTGFASDEETDNILYSDETQTNSTDDKVKQSKESFEERRKTKKEKSANAISLLKNHIKENVNTRKDNTKPEPKPKAGNQFSESDPNNVKEAEKLIRDIYE